ncbi:MAG: hypothetical protein Q7J46_14245 [Pseudomonas sp.]|nr:hypothetical protein [Pseudomonas sp.]
MSMTLSKIVQLGELRVTVRELTVGEIRAWMKRTAESSTHELVDDTLIEESSLADLLTMSDLRTEHLEELTPSQVRQLLDACREVNQDFFALRGRVEALGKQLLDQLSNDSNATLAP